MTYITGDIHGSIEPIYAIYFFCKNEKTGIMAVFEGKLLQGLLKYWSVFVQIDGET